MKKICLIFLLLILTVQIALACIDPHYNFKVVDGDAMPTFADTTAYNKCYDRVKSSLSNDITTTGLPHSDQRVTRLRQLSPTIQRYIIYGAVRVISAPVSSLNGTTQSYLCFVQSVRGANFTITMFHAQWLPGSSAAVHKLDTISPPWNPRPGPPPAVTLAPFEVFDENAIERPLDRQAFITCHDRLEAHINNPSRAPIAYVEDPANRILRKKSGTQLFYYVIGAVNTRFPRGTQYQWTCTAQSLPKGIVIVAHDVRPRPWNR